MNRSRRWSRRRRSSSARNAVEVARTEACAGGGDARARGIGRTGRAYTRERARGQGSQGTGGGGTRSHASRAKGCVRREGRVHAVDGPHTGGCVDGPRAGGCVRREGRVRAVEGGCVGGRSMQGGGCGRPHIVGGRGAHSQAEGHAFRGWQQRRPGEKSASCRGAGGVRTRGGRSCARGAPVWLLQCRRRASAGEGAGEGTGGGAEGSRARSWARVMAGCSARSRARARRAWCRAEGADPRGAAQVSGARALARARAGAGCAGGRARAGRVRARGCVGAGGAWIRAVVAVGRAWRGSRGQIQREGREEEWERGRRWPAVHGWASVAGELLLEAVAAGKGRKEPKLIPC